MNRLSMGKWRVSFFFRLIAALSVLFAVSSSSRAQIAVTVAFAPPELPVYEQPLCPAEDYIWVPGYWAWDGDDYFWVPGTWAMAPEVGFFWTPGYWGWGGGGYAWYPGYWGPTVGFYGGIVYGFGYFGHGYEGGRWDHGHFFYNRTVNNVNVTVIHNVYNTTIENRNVNVTRVSYNGGNGGVNARPTREEEAVVHERHVAMTSAQTQHFDAARQNRELRASVNQGKPPIAASVRPGEFHGLSAQFSGDGFSNMNFTARAVPQEAFAQWIAAARRSEPALDRASYTALAQQSQNVPPYTYRAIDPTLFDAVVAQQIPPGPGPGPQARHGSPPVHQAGSP